MTLLTGEITRETGDIRNAYLKKGRADRTTQLCYQLATPEHSWQPQPDLLRAYEESIDTHGPSSAAPDLATIDRLTSAALGEHIYNLYNTDTEGNSLLDTLREQCTMLAQIYATLGEQSAPFYASFAQWSQTHIEQLIEEEGIAREDIVIVFPGRDALPFASAFENAFPGQYTTTHIPTNRWVVAHHRPSWDTKTNPELLGEETDIIVQYAQDHGLLGKKWVIIDFGFEGSIERTIQLVLASQGQLTNPDGSLEPIIARILLANHRPTRDEEMAFCKVPISERLYPETAGTGPLTTDQLEQLDQKTRAQTFGFMNQFAYEARIDTSDSFMITLQELGSRTLASQGTEALHLTPKRTELVFGSVQEIIARQAFWQGLQKGLQESEGQYADYQAAVDTLRYIHAQYIRHSSYSLLRDDILTKDGHPVHEINEQLIDLGLNPVVT